MGQPPAARADVALDDAPGRVGLDDLDGDVGLRAAQRGGDRDARADTAGGAAAAPVGQVVIREPFVVSQDVEEVVDLLGCLGHADRHGDRLHVPHGTRGVCPWVRS